MSALDLAVLAVNVLLILGLAIAARIDTRPRKGPLP